MGRPRLVNSPRPRAFCVRVQVQVTESRECSEHFSSVGPVCPH